MNISTTKMSSKGQVVIPEEVRNRLGLSAGTQFVVIDNEDAVILKTIERPSVTGMGELLTTARKAAKKAGLKKSEVQEAIKQARAKK